MKTKIEKLAQLDAESIDCKSPDYHEHFSTKSFDESKASVYFTPNDGHLSPQPLQFSPIHINYINEGMIGCESASFIDDARGNWRSNPIKQLANSRNQRNSFTLPCDYLDEADESHSNFIVPEPNYNEGVFRFSNNDRFQDVAETPSSSLMSVNSSSDHSSRKRKKRFRDHRRSRPSIENEMLLMQDVVHDVSKGARPKIYGYHNYERANQRDPGELTKTQTNGRNSSFSSPEDVESDAPGTSSSVSVKKVNSQVNIDEKTGKVVSSSTSNDCDLATNINGDNKTMNQKVLKLQASSSLPDLQVGETSTPSSTGTISSNSNNQIAGTGHGVHVILALESQEDDKLNQMDDTIDGGDANNLMKRNIKLNIELASSNESSSTASSNNLEYGSASLPSTL